jgi:hypothetical protein
MLATAIIKPSENSNEEPINRTLIDDYLLKNNLQVTVLEYKMKLREQRK